MKKKKNSLTIEVEQLVEESVIAESSNKVWDHFDETFEKLDAESSQLLAAYFGGTTIEELSRRTNINKDELTQWIAKAKRELINHLRSETQLKN